MHTVGIAACLLDAKINLHIQDIRSGGINVKRTANEYFSGMNEDSQTQTAGFCQRIGSNKRTRWNKSTQSLSPAPPSWNIKSMSFASVTFLHICSFFVQFE
jgi:hypothetical protein